MTASFNCGKKKQFYKLYSTLINSGTSGNFRVACQLVCFKKHTLYLFFNVTIFSIRISIRKTFIQLLKDFRKKIFNDGMSSVTNPFVEIYPISIIRPDLITPDHTPLDQTKAR